MTRPAYPSDVSDEEWAFVAPYLTLMREDAPQHAHDLREGFNRLRYMVRTAPPWRLMPHDLPPWHTVYQQAQRWFVERCFGWSARFPRLVRDFERSAKTLKGLHFVAFAMLMLALLVRTTAFVL